MAAPRIDDAENRESNLVCAMMFPPSMPPKTPDPRDDDGPVPLFGTWPRIYAAVIVCALVVMGLLAFFSGWSY
ncbi:MAG: hypothetical protein V3S03_02780 [Vicinamibacteria bacterium]